MADSGKPRNNVYTVLVGIALLVLIVGVVYVWMRTSELTGTTNPFAATGVPIEPARAALAGVLPV